MLTVSRSCPWTLVQQGFIILVSNWTNLDIRPENCETYVRMQEVQLRNAKRSYTCAKHVMPSASFGPWSLLVRIFETSQRFAPPESPEYIPFRAIHQQSTFWKISVRSSNTAGQDMLKMWRRVCRCKRIKEIKKKKKKRKKRKKNGLRLRYSHCQISKARTLGTDQHLLKTLESRWARV